MAKIHYEKEVQQILYLCGRINCYKEKELGKEIDSILGGLDRSHIILELESQLKKLQDSSTALQQVIQLIANSG